MTLAEIGALLVATVQAVGVGAVVILGLMIGAALGLDVLKLRPSGRQSLTVRSLDEALGRPESYLPPLRLRPVADDESLVGLGLALRKLTNAGTMMMVTAHPDDVDFGAGGTVAHAIQVLDVYRRRRDLKPAGIAELNEAGRELAKALPDEVSGLVDGIAAEEKHA